MTMKYQSDAIYHELGHFLAFIAGNADYTSEWKTIYQAEKGKYTKFNKGYVCATQYEYFAESYKDYVLSKTELRQQRPQTYQYIVKTLQTANTRNATTPEGSVHTPGTPSRPGTSPAWYGTECMHLLQMRSDCVRRP